MSDKELMQQALMALEEGMTSKEWRELVKALRERLAQPEQNPLTEKRIEELYSFWIVDCQDIVGFARAIERSKPQMQPCAGRNCGSTNPNLHSAECFEDYEKSTGMAQPEQEPVAWANEIIDDLHALHDSEMIREIDSGDALIRLDAAIAAVEEAEQRYTTPPQRTSIGALLRD
jgi:hypothetical protein